MQNLYDTIRNHRREDGTLLCDEFIRAPNRRQEPGYHDVSHCLPFLKLYSFRLKGTVPVISLILFFLGGPKSDRFIENTTEVENRGIRRR